MLNRFKLIALLFSCISLMMISCTSTIFDESNTIEKVPINFSVPQIVTRAAVNNVNDLSDFRVWGWRRVSIDATEYFSVFDGEKVTKDSGWNYEGGVRYWNKGEFYNFYAVHPVLEEVSVDKVGNITINNFNCSQMGERAIDLMTADKTGIYYNGEGSGIVDLSFRHLLAKVSIVGHSEGGDANIESISLASVKSVGTYTNNGSQDTWTFTNDLFSPSRSYLILTSIPTDVFENLLLIPQSADGLKLTIRYSYSSVIDPDTQKPLVNEITYNLPNNYSWEAGKSYKYSFTLISNNIIFDVPQVNQWNEASGGIIIVD